MVVGFPIKIDPLTLSLYTGIYARVLVEVDLRKPLAKQVLITKKNRNRSNEFDSLLTSSSKACQLFVNVAARLGILVPLVEF